MLNEIGRSLTEVPIVQNTVSRSAQVRGFPIAEDRVHEIQNSSSSSMRKRVDAGQRMRRVV